MLTQLLYDLALAGKPISNQTNRGGLAELLGLAGSINVQGEEVMRPDQIADQVIFDLNDQTRVDWLLWLLKSARI